MNINKHFKVLSKFEMILWITSVIVVSASFLIAPEKDYLSLIASLIGVTALIFIAKGLVFGQILTVVFAVFYGVISYYFRYYGEMITYLFMTAPMAIVAVISWVRHPYEDSAVVEVNKVSKKQLVFLFLLTFAVTVLFYFILGSLNTANLWFSTLSIATSFFASSLTFLRSPYYAVGYAANDIVLIVLWILATLEDISSLPMVFCFIMFFVNDAYGFYNWSLMEQRQRG